MDITEVVNDVHFTPAILVANVKAHRAFFTIKGGEVKGGYVHLLTPTALAAYSGAIPAPA